MILADTSIWVDHLRAGSKSLTSALLDTDIMIHPYVIGELALGNLNNRNALLSYLSELPQTTVTTFSETLYFIEQNKLMAKGIGWVDASLLAATALTPHSQIWTRDRRLARAAGELNLRFQTHP
jgi:hypothetical protein